VSPLSSRGRPPSSPPDNSECGVKTRHLSSSFFRRWPPAAITILAMTDEKSSAAPVPVEKPPMSAADERNWAMAAHLSALVAVVSIPSFVGPLVVWLIKKDESPFVRAHSVDALNFNISVLIYLIVGSMAMVVIGLITFGIALILAIPVIFVAFVIWLILVIQGSMAASRGQDFKYPWTIKFVS
jgi:uncharacterized protein